VVEADDAARLQAAQVAEVEAAHRLDGVPDPDLTAELGSLLGELDRAADAVEELVGNVRALVRDGGYDPSSRLRAAVDEVIARAHGVRAAASAGSAGHRAGRRPS
jgi:hypothetical protein